MAPYTCITVIYCCAAKRATFCFLKWDEDDDDHGLHIEADGAGTYIWLSDEQLDQIYHVVKARWAQVFGGDAVMRDALTIAEIDDDRARAKADREHERLLEAGFEFCACGCGRYSEPGDMLGWGHRAEDLYIPEHLPQYKVEELWRCAVID